MFSGSYHSLGYHEMEFKTKRLRLILLSPPQLLMLAEDPDGLDRQLGLKSRSFHPDEHLKAAYHQMVDHCKSGKISDYLWDTTWLIVLRSENIAVGDIGFIGPPNEKGEVEIGYGVDADRRGEGYATEALKALTEWAFGKNVVFVHALVAPDNFASRCVLEKCGYVFQKDYFGCDDDGTPLIKYELERPASAWSSVYLCIGMSCGLALGVGTDNMTLGMCIGLAVGLIIGVVLDADDKKKHKREATGKNTGEK